MDATLSAGDTAGEAGAKIANLRAQAAALQQAGETFDSIFANISPTPTPPSMSTQPRPIASTSATDPQAILTIKACARQALHITQFLLQSAKAKCRARFKDTVVVGGLGERQLLVRHDEAHPYQGVSHDEWAAANIRLLNHMLTTRDIERSDIEYYLAYTTTSHAFYQKYAWSSILDFDYYYRKQQAAMGF